MQNLTTNQLREIVSTFADVDAMTSIDYAAHTERVAMARAEIKRRATCTICIVKIQSALSVSVMQSNGWAIAMNTDENFWYAWKRIGELTKFDKQTFVIFYT